MVPFTAPDQTVLPAWIDYNGHMNVAYYVLAFDKVTDALCDSAGLGEQNIARTGHSIFTLDMNVTYHRELKEGDGLRFESWPLRVGSKTFLFLHQVFHRDEGYLAASNASLVIHVSMETRRTVAFPDAIRERLAQMVEAHRGDVRFAAMERLALRVLGTKPA